MTAQDLIIAIMAKDAFNSTDRAAMAATGVLVGDIVDSMPALDELDADSLYARIEAAKVEVLDSVTNIPDDVWGKIV